MPASLLQTGAQRFTSCNVNREASGSTSRQVHQPPLWSIMWSKPSQAQAQAMVALALKGAPWMSSSEPSQS